MRTVAKRLGVMCIVVIHQPRHEVAQLFDKLMILTANPGRICYNGAMKDAVSYFTQCGYPVPPMINPTDFRSADTRHEKQLHRALFAEL